MGFLTLLAVLSNFSVAVTMFFLRLRPQMVPVRLRVSASQTVDQWDPGEDTEDKGVSPIISDTQGTLKCES